MRFANPTGFAADQQSIEILRAGLVVFDAGRLVHVELVAVAADAAAAGHADTAAARPFVPEEAVAQASALGLLRLARARDEPRALHLGAGALTARGIATELSRRAGGVAALLPWATLRGGARFALLGAGATARVAAVFAGAAGHGAAGDRLAGDGDAAFTRLGANAAARVAAVLAGAAGGGAARGSAATAASSIAATAGAAVGGRIVFDGAAATDGEGEAREHEGGEEAHAPCVARHVPAIFPGESPRAGTRGTHPGVSVTT